jgi:tripartite-type tricarboxylate transporter receptor subunit TctC
VLHGRNPAKQLLGLVVSSQTWARPSAAPPGVPDDIKAALRKSFDDTVKDPDFQAGANKLNLEVRPISWQKIDSLVAQLYAAPSDVIAKANAAIGDSM